MGFGDAIRSVLQQNYANFNGRARRSEYWFWALAFAIAYVVAYIVALAVHVLGLLLILALVLGVFVPNIAVACRRLHDTGRSGWWQLIGLVPLVGGIILIVLLCQDSQGDNQYGPSPKALGGGYPDAPYPSYPPQS